MGRRSLPADSRMINYDDVKTDSLRNFTASYMNQKIGLAVALGVSGATIVGCLGVLAFGWFKYRNVLV